MAKVKTLEINPFAGEFKWNIEKYSLSNICMFLSSK